ncbi:MAG: PriCT-2 domain-containing protein, partial [Anaerolineae bacterium]|nr:PriCT-2 domain-containing protein [Anaerolineae bacterium]
HKYRPPRPVHWVRCELERAYDLCDLESRVRDAGLHHHTSAHTHTAARRSIALEEIARATRCLERLAAWRCDEYAPWIEVGMALSELGEIGFLLWETWSQQSPSYESGVCAEKWRTFAPGQGLTLASLYYWAEQDCLQPELIAIQEPP